MINYVKMKVNNIQFIEIQKILFSNNIFWDCKISSKTKTSDYLYITDNNKISWETLELKNDKKYLEINADNFITDNFITDNTHFPIYKMQKDGFYIVRFDSNHSGEVVWIKSESEIVVYTVGEYRDTWIEFNNINWIDVNIYLYLSATQPATPSKYDEIEEDIQPGTIVLATRKSTSDKHQDYIWQGKYYGKLNEHYLLDYNGTHYQVANYIQSIPTLTKKEAKQKISELFGNPKNVSSQKIRDIIDLIED